MKQKNKHNKIITIVKIHTFAVFLGIPFYLSADNYFDPSLLIHGSDLDASQIDISQFSKENSIAPGIYNMTVIVNTEKQSEKNITFVDNTKGQIVPVFTIEMLEELGVNIDSVSDFKKLPANQDILDLKKYIPDAQVTANLKELKLNISLPQVNMKQQYGGYIDPSQLDDGVPALLLNYIVNTSRNKQTSGLSSTSNNTFVNLNGGVNLGVWRFRTNYSYNHSSTSGSGSENSSNFNSSYIMRAIIAIKSTFKIGEISTGGNIFDSIPIKGVSLASNTQMLPNSMRGYAPEVTGIANSNATVTIRQNGNVIYQTFVPPGRFKIDDISANGLAGDMEVTIQEEDGTKRVYTQAYSSLPVMVRPGQFEYELSAGQYDGGVTEGSRKSKFALGTFVYGLAQNITAYGGSLISNDYISTAVGAGISLGAFGALSADITYARAELDNSTNVGQSYRVRYSKSMLSTGTSFDLTALRYSTKDYYDFSDFNNQGYNLNNDMAPWLGYRQRASLQTSISQQLGQYGSMYFHASRNDYWGNNNTNNSLAVGYNTNIHGVNLDVSYNIDRMKTDDNNWPENRRIAFNINVPFSIFSKNELFSNMSSSYQLTNDNHGRTSQQVGLNGSAIDNKLSYGVYQNYENKDNGYSGSLNASYSGSKGNISAGYSYSDSNKNLNANVNGGVVVHSGGVTLSPMLGNNIAIVSAEGAESAHLNSGAEFDTFGNAVIPQLTDYDRNTISIDVNSLPEDVTFKNTSMTVYPTEGAVIKRKFDTKVGYQAIFNLLANNKSIPFGAIASLEDNDGSTNTGIVDGNNKLYMSGLPDSGNIIVKWGQESQSCTLNYKGLDKIETTVDSPVRIISAVCR